MLREGNNVAKAQKTSKKVKVESGFSIPSLLALAFLLALLCVLPWLSQQDGTSAFRALQVSVALLLALAGGFFLGLQVGSKK